MTATLENAIVRRVDAIPRLHCVEVRADRVWVLLLSQLPGASGIGALPREKLKELWNGGRLPPGATRVGSPLPLESARIAGLSSDLVSWLRGGELWRLVVRPFRALEMERASDGEPEFLLEEAELVARGEKIALAHAQAALESARKTCIDQMDRALVRLRRRRDAVRSDLLRMDDADKLMRRAQWLLPEAARVPRGATSMELTDWSTGVAVIETIALNPALSAREQVDAMFKKARRLKRGFQVATARLEQTERVIEHLEQLVSMAKDAASAEELSELLEASREAAPGEVPKAKPKATARPTRIPYREFSLSEGRVLVGRGAEDNDELTLHIAKPHDLWLHAKGHAGAHVIAILQKGHAPSAELLVSAAHLAAHFSDARGEKTVEVSYVPRRYVRKPKGSAPGAVSIDREKVLVLRVDEARLAQLLQRETNMG